MDQRLLVEVIASAFMSYEHATDADVDPDWGIKVMEGLSATLEQLSAEGRSEFKVDLETLASELPDDPFYDGWRDFSPSTVKQFFGKIGYETATTDFDLSLTMGDTDLEPFMMADLEELAEVGTQDGLNLVALVDRSVEELEGPVGNLEDWTGAPVTSFAYPHGFHDRRVRDLVVDAGFTSACAVKQALSSPTDDPFALARIMPTGDVTAEELVDRLRSPRTPVSTGDRQALRTRAYRYVRRFRQEVAA